jgi:polyether ionophore transport system permease protein
MLRSIFWKTMREQRWALLIWSALVMLILIAVYASLSQIDVSQLGNLAQNRAYAFLSDPVATDTASGYVTFKYGFSFSLMLSIFAMLVGSRLVRGEEARGSMDLLLATPHSRAGLLREKALAAVVGVLILGVAFGVGALLGEASQHDAASVGGTALAGLDLSLLLFFYAMLALFISQYTRTAGTAAGATGALYALFFVLDGTGRTYPNVAWVQRLSPNYYYGLSKPLIPSYGTNFGAMALLLALGLLLLAGSMAIFLKRDMGAVATLPFQRMRRNTTARTASPDARIERAARDPWLRSVLARSLRASGPGLGWWMLGVFLYTAYGAGIVKSSERQLRDAIAGSPAFAQLFGANLLATDYGFVSLVVFLIVSIAAMLYALIRANNWPADQDNGRLDIVLSTPQPRWRVALQWYGTAVIGFILLALASAFGVMVGAAATHLTLDTGRVFAASLSLVPPMALIAGAVYALGARLRSAVDLEIVGAYLGIAFFMDLLGDTLHLPGWVRHLSLFTAYGTPIVNGVNWPGIGVMLLLAALFTGIGVYLFQTGDVRQGG